MKYNLESHYTYTALRPLLLKRNVKFAGVVDQFLEQINLQQSLNAFINVYGQEILKKASSLDQQPTNEPIHGALAGMVVGLKDLIAYKDHPLQAASKILLGYISPFHATVTERLLQAGALIIGHQNCDEFGMGSSSENSHFGPVKNPVDPTRVAGGSSGGSAAAVKAKMCHISIGTDTGGSVRQPAAFCGLTGLKPTYGRISRYGLVAYGSSLDTPGILAHNIEDCASVLETIAGPDELDHITMEHKKSSYLTARSHHRQYKIAYLEETLTNSALQPAIKNNTLGALSLLAKEGHKVDDVHFKLLKYALPTYYILVNAEASTNLACYDGIRYGYRSPSAKTLEEVYLQTRTEGFSQEVKKRIMVGTCVLSTSQSTHYLKALKVQSLIKQAMKELLDEYDFILLPTTTTTAFPLNNFSAHPMMYWGDLYTVIASVAGLPAISLPNGVDEHQLPIGLQVIGNYFKEDKLLNFGYYFQQLVQNVKR